MSICAVGFLRRTSSRTSKPDDFRSPAQNPSNSLQCSEVETSSGGAPNLQRVSARSALSLGPQFAPRDSLVTSRRAESPSSLPTLRFRAKRGSVKGFREEFIAGAYNHHVPWTTLLFG